jgi:hypothetical protein
MGEAASDHHTVDGLFQILCVRNIPPVQVRRQILEACQDDKLKINYHIRGGSQKTVPIHPPATDEELKAISEKRVTPEYEVAPPEGITGHVHPQSWERVFTLRIKEGHLVVEPRCGLDYPWDAYSFTIANWSVVNELWPPLVRTFVPPAVPVMDTSPTVPATVAPALEIEPAPKMPQLAWVKDYLTKEKKDELSTKYDQVTKAAEAVFEAMKKTLGSGPTTTHEHLNDTFKGFFQSVDREPHARRCVRFAKNLSRSRHSRKICEHF